jgi:prephenate dehydrogenase/chorismate mutase
MTSPSVARLRREIAETDERILRDVAHRIELARAIGQQKRAERIPLRDYLIERQVVERWVRGLRSSGVPPERIEVLVRWLIEEAVYAQESIPEPVGEATRGSDVVVVGGLGQMGGWMCDFLRASGHRVGIVDRRSPRAPVPYPVTQDLARAVGNADLVVLATPMRVTPTVYEKVLATETEATIFDILSVKAPIVRTIRRAVADGAHVSSTHPLFGPGTRSLFGRNLLVLDCGDEEANRTVSRLFSRTALRVTRWPLEQHDPLMVEALGLPHLLSLLFARTLQHGGRSPAELGRAASTSFRRIQEVAQVVTRENPELVGDIQTLNPYSKELFRLLGAALADLEGAVTRGDSGEYASLLEQGRRFLAQSVPDSA